MQNILIELSVSQKEQNTKNDRCLEHIEALDEELEQHFKQVFYVNSDLNRALVSFQANKKTKQFRWFNYKEGFSAALVEYLIDKYSLKMGKILDPFSGTGTTLFVASTYGIASTGIELLPIGNLIINARYTALTKLSYAEFELLEHYANVKPWKLIENPAPLNTLRITEGAYPEETEIGIRQFLAFSQEHNNNMKEVLLFALCCVLESVSFTRKDGQYLRWDARASRKYGGKSFNKGTVLNFDTAISEKIFEIVKDLNPENIQYTLFSKKEIGSEKLEVIDGSCLYELKTLAASSYHSIITSPPYCNRYDYTRTYALELAVLGVTESQIINLRQEMLSCTVENKEKALLNINPAWENILRQTSSLALLKKIIEYLESLKFDKLLNNNGIPRMVKGYFLESACVIFESFRLLKPGGFMFMVNDNVRYAGVSISVDMILSRIAEYVGFEVEKIMVLPSGKGNSSQQMGIHGRKPLRKCIYVWKKPWINHI